MFGDGSNSTLIGPHTKTYPNTGVDSVKLIVSGLCGIDSITQVINIDSLPYATHSITPLSGCSPLLVSGNSVPFGSNTTTRWYKNGGFLSTGNSFSGTTFNNISGNSIVSGSIRFNISNHWNSLGILEREFLIINQKDSLQNTIQYEELPFGRLIVWHGKRILWIDKKLHIRDLALKVDYLILSNNSVWKAEDLQNIEFEELIIDGTYFLKNAQKFKNHYKNTYITNLKGAWMKDLNK